MILIICIFEKLFWKAQTGTRNLQITSGFVFAKKLSQFQIGKSKDSFSPNAKFLKAPKKVASNFEFSTSI